MATKGDSKQLEKRVDKLEKTLKALDYEHNHGVWLEVAEVQLDSRLQCCRVQLKADKTQPKPIWWTVDSNALSSKTEPQDAALETYRAILNELDKNRVVLARLSSSGGSGRSLRCSVFRFQSAELGSRLS